MKSIKSLLWMLVILPAFLLNSCEKQIEIDQEGTLELGIILDQLDGQLKSALEDSSDIMTHFVVISVVNENGEMVLDNERLELYNFSGHWITQEIKLKIGQYELTKFIVVNWEGNVRLAAPLEGSPMAYLVNHPLPLSFGIRKDEVTRVVPEVLAVINEPPEAFGYATFGYNVVKTLDFFVAVYIDDPRIMAPSRYTDAKLTVIIDSVWRHSFLLEPRVNRLRIRKEDWGYLLIVNKEGFAPKKLRVSTDELLKTSPDNPLLIGLPVEDFNVLVLQPGPEEGKDAMLSRTLPEGNFGKFPFFEATTSPLETSDVQHKLTRSLIQFDLNQLPKSATIKRAVLTLYYPEHIYHDSIMFDGNMPGYRTDIDTMVPWPVEYLAVMQKVISPWEEHEVTWETQPKTTEINQVFIPRVYYLMDAYCDCFVPPISETIDVTELLMPDEAGNRSYGLLLKLFNEENPEWMRFASSDFLDMTASNLDLSKPLWPKLEIYYTLPN
jgi:hypothetical protein